jgi:hypothetical protein
MKFLLIFLALTSFACNQDLKSHAADDSKISITDNKLIIGEWGIYSTSGGGSVTMCNVCPKILFTEVAAFVTNPSGAIETFTWTLKNNVLTVSYINPAIDRINRTFPDSIYNTVFIKQNKQSELEIHKIKSDQSYLLRKQL